MWQSTKKLVRQLIEQNTRDFALINEKYEEILTAKREADEKIENLLNMVSLLMKNQTTFITDINQVISSVSEAVGKIDNEVVVLSEKISDGYDALKTDTDRLHEMSGAVKQQCGQLLHEIKVNEEKKQVMLMETRNEIFQSLEQYTATVKETMNDNNAHVVRKMDCIEKLVNDDSERRILDAMNTSLTTIKDENGSFRQDVYRNEKVIAENLGIINHTVQQLITNIAQLDEASRLLIAKTLLKDMEF